MITGMGFDSSIVSLISVGLKLINLPSQMVVCVCY